MDPQHLISNIGILVIQPSAPFGHIWKYTGGSFRSSSERHEVIQGLRFPLLLLFVLRCSFYDRRFPCVVLRVPEFLYVLRFTFDLLHVSLCVFVLAFASFYVLLDTLYILVFRFTFSFYVLRFTLFVLRVDGNQPLFQVSGHLHAATRRPTRLPQTAKADPLFLVRLFDRVWPALGSL